MDPAEIKNISKCTHGTARQPLEGSQQLKQHKFSCQVLKYSEFARKTAEVKGSAFLTGEKIAAVLQPGRKRGV